MNLTALVAQAIAITESVIDPAVLRAFLDVESAGRGFDPDTKKLIIQFEPVWFKRKARFAPSGAWTVNRVEVQAKEWQAFNNAFAINPDAAMESTSIGLPQIMGLHWQRLGFDSVGAMWDSFKKSELNQIIGLIKFIETDPVLLRAIVDHDWHRIAYIYNGSGYMAIAHNYKREPYNVSLANAYQKYRAV